MSQVSAVTTPPQIERALRQASEQTGTDFDYLLRTAIRESGLRPQIKSSTSSATGLFQFIEQTWYAMIKKAGHEYGLGDYADAISQNADGRYNVADPELRQEILALRTDPQTAALMAGEYTRDSGDTLQNGLGRAPLVGELYLAHFLGSEGALRMIRAAEQTPDTLGYELFPRAARANRPIFYERSGEARTIEEVYQNLVSQHGLEVAHFGPQSQPVAASSEDSSAGQGQNQIMAAAAEMPSMTLASHFEGPRSGITGQGFFTDGHVGSLVQTVASPAPEESGGPMVIIPEAFRVLADAQDEANKPGAILQVEDRGPVFDTASRGSLGLLERFSPFHSLFSSA